jgi:RNA polymerase subunit RPABC4/transcription elongation factor Spt4
MAQLLENLNLQQLLTYFSAGFVAFLAALWLSLIVWTVRDLRYRTQDRLTPILAALLVGLLGPAGLLIYAILRPPLTLEDSYQQTLETEALLASIADATLCPGCSARTRAEWQICPQCHTRLRKPCANCGQLLDLPWKLCPYCATPAPEVQPQESRKAALADD